jgi:hypothetical protein
MKGSFWFTVSEILINANWLHCFYACGKADIPWQKGMAAKSYLLLVSQEAERKEGAKHKIHPSK